MKSLEEIESQVIKIFKTNWEKREGSKVPETSDLKLTNDAVELDATILYADLKESTELVKGYKNWFSAEIYKAYLLSCCELIRNNEGVITSFDGDRVMGIFIGDSKNTNAATTGLQINYVVDKVIIENMKKQYPNNTYKLEQAVGIDNSKVFVARTGIRGDNDLVWVGNAANMAAKMCSIRKNEYRTYISASVYNHLNESVKYGGKPKRLMWDEIYWDDYATNLYASTWWWKPK
jgi:uridylate cyclase